MSGADDVTALTSKALGTAGDAQRAGLAAMALTTVKSRFNSPTDDLPPCRSAIVSCS